MTRALTREEESLRQRRLAGLSAFLEQRQPVLVDFARRLELAEPEMIATDAEPFLPGISAFMRGQSIGEDDRIWILTRIGYYTGSVLAQRLGGSWFLNEIPDSRYFLHYVVGKFARAKNPNAMVAPFEVSEYFLRQPPGRDLATLVSEVESEIRAA